jgi:1-acyl-sn-glycerol-3-phosphate acyltransferase
VAATRALHQLLAPLARLIVWLLADLRVVGAERVPARGGVLLAANHVSFLDPVVLAVALYACGRRKVRFLALADLFDHPLVGWVLRGTRMIPVARGRGAARMADDACAALDAGQAVLVYPEGTIVPPGQTRPARPGAGLVALRASVPVLPIASRGLERHQSAIWCPGRLGVTARWLPEGPFVLVRCRTRSSALPAATPCRCLPAR